MNKAALKASLFEAIDNWMGSNIDDENENWPDFWIHDELVEQMTDAAMIVLEASIKSSEFTQGNS